MDSTLLTYPVVIEVPLSSEEDTIYYSSKVAKDVTKAIKGAGAKASKPTLYCHVCFKKKGFKNRKALEEHEKKCRFGGRTAHTPGCWQHRGEGKPYIC